MIAIDRIVVIALLWAFLSAGSFIAARSQTRAGRVAWLATLVGMLAARVGYVAENADAFGVEPWTVLAFWQGGFSLWPGVIAAAVVIIALLWRSRAMVGLLAALTVLTTVQLATSALLAPASRPMPGNIILAELDGRPVDLGSLRGRPFVLNMWASWCPPCRREMPMLIDVAARSDVPILLVNQGEDAAKVRAYLERERLSAASIRLDPKGILSQATGSRAMPITLFIDASGRIQRTHAGEISRAALQAELRDPGRKTS
ncbi:MAG: TlpA disulfide reductase family protein [Sphingobium sp.]